MPCRPSAPILGQRSLGNRLLLSISAARGAISLLEKANTVSRIASAVSPRSKLNIRYVLAIMVGRPPASQLWLCCAQPYSLQISLSRAEPAEKGQAATFADLLDHLVGGREQRRWDGEVEGLGGIDVDDEIELGRDLDRQVARFRSVQDAIDMAGGSPKQIHVVRAV